MTSMQTYCIYTIFSCVLLSSTASANYNWEQLNKSEQKWNNRQPYEKILNFIPITKGMVVGEIGAGKGRYTVFLSQAVGKNGTVYANDISSKALDTLTARKKHIHATNIIPVKGEILDPMFPKNNLDCIFMTNTYHHIDNIVQYLKNASAYLSKNGIFAIVEHTPEKFNKNHATSRTTIINNFDAIGFTLQKEDASLPFDTIYIFKQWQLADH